MKNSIRWVAKLIRLPTFLRWLSKLICPHDWKHLNMVALNSGEDMGCVCKNCGKWKP